MILYEYAYFGGDIVVREVECEKVEDRYIGVGIARREDMLGELVGNLNIFLMYLPERDDIRFLKALVARVGGELVEQIKQASRLNAAIDKHLKKVAGDSDEQVCS